MQANSYSQQGRQQRGLHRYIEKLAGLSRAQVTQLLGPGMMAVLKNCPEESPRHYTTGVDLAHLPQNDPLVYRPLQKADTSCWFQVESRAQMSCLPRMQPRCFYDIVIQVAIIRPGPIQGDMLHAFLRRRKD